MFGSLPPLPDVFVGVAQGTVYPSSVEVVGNIVSGESFPNRTSNMDETHAGLPTHQNIPNVISNEVAFDEDIECIIGDFLNFNYNFPNENIKANLANSSSTEPNIFEAPEVNGIIEHVDDAVNAVNPVDNFQEPFEDPMVPVVVLVSRSCLGLPDDHHNVDIDVYDAAEVVHDAREYNNHTIAQFGPTVSIAMHSKFTQLYNSEPNTPEDNGIASREIGLTESDYNINIDDICGAGAPLAVNNEQSCKRWLEYVHSFHKWALGVLASNSKWVRSSMLKTKRRPPFVRHMNGHRGLSVRSGVLKQRSNMRTCEAESKLLIRHVGGLEAFVPDPACWGANRRIDA